MQMLPEFFAKGFKNRFERVYFFNWLKKDSSLLKDSSYSKDIRSNPHASLLISVIFVMSSLILKVWLEEAAPIPYH